MRLHARTRTRARTHARAHTQTHTQVRRQEAVHGPVAHVDGRLPARGPCRASVPSVPMAPLATVRPAYFRLSAGTPYSRGTHGMGFAWVPIGTQVVLMAWVMSGYPLVLKGYSAGTHWYSAGYSVGYSAGTQRYPRGSRWTCCASCCRGTQRVLTGFSRGTPVGRCVLA
jgi:hypothetical protein